MTTLQSRVTRFTAFGLFLAVLLVLAVANPLLGQPKYRTFSQDSLALKKSKAGKITGSHVCFTFHNTTDSIANDLHIKFNFDVRAIEDSGGYTTFTFGKGKVLDASGKDVPPGDSVTLCFAVSKKDSESHANQWWWTKNGSPVSPKYPELPSYGYVPIHIQPNGGNILEHLYKKILTRPNGLVVGIPQATKDSALVHGWMRFMKADRKYFPHLGEPRCFDEIAAGNGGSKPFVKELKNAHVKKHDNHLLGELHALKLACVANDSGVTEPLDTTVTLFCDLLYQDTVNLGDDCNGLTIREIIHLADSMLTYCAGFDSVDYAHIDYCISRINAAFDGPYEAVSFSPFVLAGTRGLDEVYFLRQNPIAVPRTRPASHYDLASDLPKEVELQQNYPNPFNPTTTIEFKLPATSLVTIKVYNMLGQEVASLLDGESLDEGDQSVEFDASMLPSGIYLYRIIARDTEGRAIRTDVVKKMVLLK
jgi:hypothetical protein